HPHNGYLLVLDDTGLLGALVLTWAGLGLVLAGARAYASGGERERAYVAAASAALVTLALHALTDSPNPSKTALIPAVAVVALVLRLAPLPAPRRVLASLTTVSRLTVPVLILVIGGAWFRIDSAQHRYQSALHAVGEGHFAASATKAGAAVDSDPH